MLHTSNSVNPKARVMSLNKEFSGSLYNVVDFSIGVGLAVGSTIFIGNYSEISLNSLE